MKWILFSGVAFAYYFTSFAQALTISRRLLTSLTSFSLSTTTLNMSTSTTPSSGIGFIGLGIMGQGMAARLLTQGIAGTSSERPLVIWNRTPTKCQALVDQFPDAHIIVKESPAAVVQACTVTYSMLSTPEASRAVFDDADTGTLAGISTGKCIVDCATLSQSDMQRMHDAVVAKGGRFLEAPVSGSKGPAAQGTLVFLCAGDRALYDDIQSTALAAMGKASYFLNDQVGAGTRAKLVVNSLMGTMLAALGEGLTLADAVGLDANTMVDIIGQGAMACPMFALKGPKMVSHDHAPNFPLKHAHKDMQLARDLAQQTGVEYSVMNTAETLFRQARESNNGAWADLDFSAIVEQVQADSTQLSSSSKDKEASS